MHSENKTALPKMYVGQYSDVGNLRQENQDALGSFSTPKGELFIVADGMGGVAGGKIASEMAVKFIRETFKELDYPLPQLLEESILEANTQIYEHAQSGDPHYRKMGTTVVALVVVGKTGFIAHIGDSRAYLIRNDVITRLTKDHSEIQTMIDMGTLSEEEARNHPSSNILLRCLGTKPAVEVDMLEKPIEIQDGDYFLLCTDGLTTQVVDEEILGLVLEQKDPARICRKLVNLANQRGGPDNSTVQIINFGEVEKPAPSFAKKYDIQKIFFTTKKLYLPLFVLIAALIVLFYYRSDEPLFPEKNILKKEKSQKVPLIGNESSFYTIQIEALSDSAGAVNLRDSMNILGVKSYILYPGYVNDEFYRVRTGRFLSNSEAQDSARNLVKNGIIEAYLVKPYIEK